ncbi:MAG TPA: signal recognition particle receptor subunit alpha, partial [Telluria sp.]|nr:signal recognition particle receptor subunit alpha [Telluria sp.]
MFSFFKKKPPESEIAPPEPVVQAPAPVAPAPAPATGTSRRYGTTSTFVAPPVAPAPPRPDPIVLHVPPAERIVETAERLGSEADRKSSWMTRLKAGLSKTSSNLSLLFVGARIDEDLYEELESALLMADAGMDATQFLLDGLRRKVKEDKLLDASAVKAALKVL